MTQPQQQQQLTIQQAMDLAVRWQQAGRLAEAERIYRQILARESNHPDAMHLLGVLALQAGQLEAAENLIRRAIGILPAAPQFHSNLGQVLAGLGRTDEAIAAVRRALELDPSYAGAHFNLGNLLQASGQIDEAISAFRRSADLQPGFADAHYNLGNALHARGRLEEAAAEYRRAVALEPRHVQAMGNLGNILHLGGQYEQAIATLREALAIAPDHAESHHNLGLTLLLLGQYGEGWGHYEWRWKLESFTASRVGLAKPAWDGGPLNGRRLLICAEQGFGDTLQFARYIPMLSQRIGNGTIIVESRREMLRLQESLTCDFPLEFAVRDEPAPPFDLHCPLLSLPRMFGTTIETIPAGVPYLRADQALSDRWRGRISADGIKVGLAWAGKALPNPKRTVPVEQLAPLLDVPGVSFVSLQKEKSGQATRDTDFQSVEEAQHGLKPRVTGEAAPSFSLIDWTSELRDFADSAALIDNLDVVITIDTAVAHLAGAMGKPTWVLLPFVPDWRWLLDRTDSPWYPTMRLFRQPVADDWRAPIEQAARELSRWRR